MFLAFKMQFIAACTGLNNGQVFEQLLVQPPSLSMLPASELRLFFARIHLALARAHFKLRATPATECSV